METKFERMHAWNFINLAGVFGPRGLPSERGPATAPMRHALLGHALSGNLFVEPYLVTLQPDARPHVTFQHPGLKFLYLLSGAVT